MSRPTSRRPSLSNRPSLSPRITSSNAVNEVVNEVVSALQRKLTAAHIEGHQSHPTPSRGSFSMDGILHRGKGKKQDDGGGRDEKRKAIIKLDAKAKDRNAAKSVKMPLIKPVHFEIIWESPPLVMLLNTQNSSGALMSERIKLHVDDPSGMVTLTSWTATLRAVRKTKKPIGRDCLACGTVYEELRKAEIIIKPTTYRAGKDNQVPFSFHFAGHLPGTTECQLGSISYELVVQATTSTGENIIHIEPISLQRALPEGSPKYSIRIFPPTNLTSRVQLPPVVHPIGTFPVELTLSGVIDQRDNSHTRWRMRKLSWRIEEHSKIVSTPCPNHSHKVAEGKAILYNETRTLGNDDLKSGWKSDFDTLGGEIYCEFEAGVATKPSHKAVCDVDSPTGMAVWHNLVIELIVAEEICPTKHSQLVTPTGAARVLRMQFALVVTERAGMGISWDEEQPPMYEDVPASPPGYGSADRNDGAWGGAEMVEYQYEGDPLEQTYLARMGSIDLNAPPTYSQESINSGLPTRTQETSPASNGEASGQTATMRSRWTLAELEEEPRHIRRMPSNSSQGQEEEDYGAGSSSAAVT
ncbi:hypothetical protein DV736_g5604, partial [Chaetothyriales sp. CBS 134916]